MKDTNGLIKKIAGNLNFIATACLVAYKAGIYEYYNGMGYVCCRNYLSGEGEFSIDESNDHYGVCHPTVVLKSNVNMFKQANGVWKIVP